MKNNHRFRSRHVLIALLALLAPRLAAADPVQYTITDLGTLPGKANSWVWIGIINNSGVVAAYANDNPPNPNAFAGDVAYLWNKGRITILPGLPGATDSPVIALNDHNQAVGYSGADGFDQVQAVLWDKGRIQVLESLLGDPYSQAWCLNNRGQIAGFSYTFNPGFAGQHAVIWEQGKAHLLAPRPTPLSSGPDRYEAAYGINNRGQIVGQSGAYDSITWATWDVHAVLWEISDSDPVDLGVDGAAQAINDRGQITGSGAGPGGKGQTFLWDRGVVTFLGLVAGDEFSGPYGINNHGQIVGQSAASFTDVSTSKAILWENGQMINLQTRIPASSGWRLLSAGGINERGQIACHGIHNGQYRACLLTPLP
jgi:probable HAF family extracellular repeat protein